MISAITDGATMGFFLRSMGFFFRTTAVIVAAIAAGVFTAIPRKVDPGTLQPSLSGMVALVTGASRGIGFGIASSLIEAGATVYITGRRKATVLDACARATSAGGECHALEADSSSDKALKKVFDAIVKQSGHLDILVNNAFSFAGQVDPYVGEPFWRKGTSAGHMFDAANAVGLRSHYVASVHAAKLMAEQRSGTIVHVSSFGGLNYFFDVAYGVGKAAIDRMAADMQVELAPFNVTSISLWPGLVETEEVHKQNSLGAQSNFRRLKAGAGVVDETMAMDVGKLLGTPLSETPRGVGRAVAAVARDPSALSDLGGKISLVSSLMVRYDLEDERGFRPPSLLSVKAVLLQALPSLDNDLSRLWMVPDVPIVPFWLIKLASSSPRFA